MMSMLRGIDISQWQGQPNFDAIKPQVDFLFIRSSYGDGFVDPQFNRNRNEALRLGIPHGLYHYAYPQYNTPEAEAAWFLKVVGNIVDGEVLVLDFEERYPGDVVGWCKAFLDYISAKLGGYKPLIYLNLSQTKNYNWARVIDGNYGLWLAYYDNNPISTNWDTPWPFTTMRQWTAVLRIAGISGNVDGNVFYGNLDAFKKYGYSHPVPPPPPNYQDICLKVKAEINSGDADGDKLTKISTLVSNL